MPLTAGSKIPTWPIAVAARNLLLTRLTIENAQRVSTISGLTLTDFNDAELVTSSGIEEYQINTEHFKTAGYVSSMYVHCPSVHHKKH